MVKKESEKLVLSLKNVRIELRPFRQSPGLNIGALWRNCELINEPRGKGATRLTLALKAEDFLSVNDPRSGKASPRCVPIFPLIGFASSSSVFYFSKATKRAFVFVSKPVTNEQHERQNTTKNMQLLSSFSIVITRM